jgi:glycosyltransferase involved in cell wall biosynthesis
VNILFPYMARWKAVNWQRFQQLLVTIARKGHRVHVLESPPLKQSQENSYRDIDVELPSTMEVHQVHVWPRLWNLDIPMGKVFRKGILSLAQASLIKQIVKQHDIDVVIVYNIPQYFVVLRSQCLTVFDMVDDLVAMLDHEIEKPWRTVAVRLAEVFHRRLVGSCDLVTVSTEALAEKCRGKTTFLLPNGADLNDTEMADGHDIRSRYPTPIVGFFGAVEYFTDLNLVLEAAGRLKDVSFLIVGGGRKLEEATSGAVRRGLQNVFFTGPVTYWEGLNYVKAMDICLIPFRKNQVTEFALPLKLFQYAGLRKPIISTSVREVLRVGGPFVTFADNASQLVWTISHMLQHPESYDAKIDEGHRLVMKLYNWDTVANNFLRLIQERL